MGKLQTVSTENWSRESLAWFAGLFEGEGHIRSDKVNGYGPYLKMQLTSTDLDTLHRAMDIVGAGHIGHKREATKKHKARYDWLCTRSGDVYAIAVAMYPYLCSRRKRQVEQALDSWA